MIYLADKHLASVRYSIWRFSQDSLRRASWAYVGWLLSMLSISVITWFVFRSAPYSSIIPSLFIYYLVGVSHVVLRLKKGGAACIMAPDILYVFLYTLFHLGYVTLYAFGIVPQSNYIFFFDDSIPKAMLVINIGLIAFLFGQELMAPKRPVSVQQCSYRVPTAPWCLLGIFFMITALAMHVAALLAVALDVSRTRGYSGLQNIDRYASFFWVVTIRQSIPLMAFGTVLYVVSSALRNGKLFASKLALLLFVTFLVVVTLEGNRTEMLLFGLPVLLLRHYLIKRIRTRYLVVILAGTLVLFTVLGVARTIVFSPKQMWAEYEYQQSSGRLSWATPFAEMGGSFLAVNITCHAVPEQEPYWMGTSWANSVVHVVPFLQGALGEKGLLWWAPSEWLTYTFFGTEASGRAFTVAAEGYLNFGFPGVFFQLMCFGLFVRWLSIRFAKNPSAQWGLILIGCLGPSFIVIRNHVNLSTSVIVHVFLIAWLLNSLLGSEPVYESEEIDP